MHFLGFDRSRPSPSLSPPRGSDDQDITSKSSFQKGMDQKFTFFQEISNFGIVNFLNRSKNAKQALRQIFLLHHHHQILRSVLSEKAHKKLLHLKSDQELLLRRNKLNAWKVNLQRINTYQLRSEWSSQNH